MSTVGERVEEVLETFGSKERFIGVVDHYDLAGTTAYIRSGDQFYLAFASDIPGKPGQLVSFKRDQSRARDITTIEESNGSKTRKDVSTESRAA